MCVYITTLIITKYSERIDKRKTLFLELMHAMISGDVIELFSHVSSISVLRLLLFITQTSQTYY